MIQRDPNDIQSLVRVAHGLDRQRRFVEADRITRVIEALRKHAVSTLDSVTQNIPGGKTLYQNTAVTPFYQSQPGFLSHLPGHAVAPGTERDNPLEMKAPIMQGETPEQAAQRMLEEQGYGEFGDQSQANLEYAKRWLMSYYGVNDPSLLPANWQTMFSGSPATVQSYGNSAQPPSYAGLMR